MIRSFTVLFSIIIFASMVYAQNAPEAPAGYRAELTQGTSFTGFQWTPGVGDFNGKLASVVETNLGGDMINLYGVHYGYFISTSWAIGGVLDFGSTSSENTADQTKMSSTVFGITAFVNKYFQPKFQNVAAWVGAGVTFGSYSRTDEDTGPTPAKTEFSANSIGFFVDFGGQYFIDEGFALNADYKLGFLSFSEPESTTTGQPTDKGASLTLFGTMTGSLGINFYF